MSQFIREIEPGVELFRDAVTGIAWAEDHRTGLGVSVHPNIDESGSVEGMIARGWWRRSDRIARSHGWIYNIDRFACNDEDTVEAIVAEECMCPACIERRAAQVERKRYVCPRLPQHRAPARGEILHDLREPFPLSKQGKA